MKVQCRIPRSIFENMLLDLTTPHDFAAERIGFLSASLSKLDGGDELVLFNDYFPVRDSEYMPDLTVGARINSSAIRSAMQQIMDSKLGMFHVHLHPDGFPLRFSRADCAGYARLLPSFRSAGPQLVHGALIINSDGAYGAVLLPGAEDVVEVGGLSVVGFPMRSYRGN
jgi:hypothetical protein